MPLTLDDLYSLIDGTLNSKISKAIEAALDDKESDLSKKLDAMSQRAEAELNRFSEDDLVEHRPKTSPEISSPPKVMKSLQIAAGTVASKELFGEKEFWQWRNSEIQAECSLKHNLFELRIRLLTEQSTPGEDSIEIYWVNVDGTFELSNLKAEGTITRGKLSVFLLQMQSGEMQSRNDTIVLVIKKDFAGVKRVLRYELPFS